MSRTSYLALCAALALATSACGNNPTDRALTGGAIGAGGGALERDDLIPNREGIPKRVEK